MIDAYITTDNYFNIIDDNIYLPNIHNTCVAIDYDLFTTIDSHIIRSIIMEAYIVCIISESDNIPSNIIHTHYPSIKIYKSLNTIIDVNHIVYLPATYDDLSLARRIIVVMCNKTKHINSRVFPFAKFGGYNSNYYMNRVQTNIGVVIEFKRDMDEYKYLAILADIMNNGISKGNTLALFNKTISYDIETSDDGYYKILMLTSKKVFFKSVFEELKWFMNGNTDNKLLKNVGVNIWSYNSAREQLDARGLTDYAVDECGPIYGYQWRNFGASSTGDKSGVDQLNYIVNELRNNPTSRRAILSAWNPVDLPKMCLPPCHMVYNFYVVNDRISGNNRLSVTMTQRSGDIFLGIPFNLVSTSLLLIYIARIVDMKVGSVTINICDCHLYKEHVTAANTQLSRRIHKMPRIRINKQLRELTDVYTLNINDFDIAYTHEPVISAKLC